MIMIGTRKALRERLVVLLVIALLRSGTGIIIVIVVLVIILMSSRVVSYRIVPLTFYFLLQQRLESQSNLFLKYIYYRKQGLDYEFAIYFY